MAEVNANGDGFVLRTKDGTNVPLVLLMFIEGKTQQQLAGLAREKGVTFRARGYAASDGRRTYFEPSRCTFIHRMPATAPRTPNDSDDQDQEKQMEKIQKTVLTQGKVCPDPNRPCDTSGEWKLSSCISLNRNRSDSHPRRDRSPQRDSISASQPERVPLRLNLAGQSVSALTP